jgi:hypothetical protein
MTGGAVHTAFECRVGWLAGWYKRRRAGQVGRYILASQPGQEGTHRSLYTFMTHKRLPHRQQFSASQDADSISLALNNICPWSHFHTVNNAKVIPLNGLTV